MLFNIRMGLSDIWRQKLFFLIGILFLVLFHTIFAMTAFTYINDQATEDQKEKTVFAAENLVNTQYDYVNEGSNIEEFAVLMEENAVATRPSHSLSSRTSRTVTLVLGDARLIHPQMPNKEGVHAYAFDLARQDHLQVEDAAYPLAHLPFDDTGELPYDTIYLVYQGPELIKVLHLLVSNNPNVFFEVLENVHVLKADPQKSLQIQNFIKQKVEGAGIKGSLLTGPLEGVEDFFTHFLIPLLCILMVFGLLCFRVLFHGNLQRMKRDLTIHIQSGAKFQDVLARFAVFYGSILFISFYILTELGMVIDLLRPFVLTSYAVISLGSLLYIAQALLRSNLFENMRGDMV